MRQGERRESAHHEEEHDEEGRAQKQLCADDARGSLRVHGTVEREAQSALGQGRSKKPAPLVRAPRRAEARDERTGNEGPSVGGHAALHLVEIAG